MNGRFERFECFECNKISENFVFIFFCDYCAKEVALEKIRICTKCKKKKYSKIETLSEVTQTHYDDYHKSVSIV